ncbi:MAG: KH domain-containing protein [Candidatus Fimenecus sp.]
MKELIEFMAKGLVNNPDAVTVTVDEEPDERGYTVYHLKVADEDMGRVIGKEGRIANAIRVIAKARAAKDGQKVNVEIDD